jgi:hypothetical protein
MKSQVFDGRSRDSYRGNTNFVNSQFVHQLLSEHKPSHLAGRPKIRCVNAAASFAFSHREGENEHVHARPSTIVIVAPRFDGLARLCQFEDDCTLRQYARPPRMRRISTPSFRYLSRINQAPRRSRRTADLVTVSIPNIMLRSGSADWAAISPPFTPRRVGSAKRRSCKLWAS